MLIDRCIKFRTPEDKDRFIKLSVSRIEPEIVVTQWKRVLDRATREQDVHDFLELHPELLPGLYDLHNGPLHGIVVSKFPFGADYKCDFAFLTRHSMALQFTFVEIEDPRLPIFNKDGSFSQSFNHARQQIADWRVWVEKNIDSLMGVFSPMFETYNARDDRKDFRFYLVYGRRREVETDKKRKERWGSIEASDDKKTKVMSYDRLNLIGPVKDRHIVCVYRDRSFCAKPELLRQKLMVPRIRRPKRRPTRGSSRPRKLGG